MVSVHRLSVVLRYLLPSSPCPGGVLYLREVRREGLTKKDRGFVRTKNKAFSLIERFIECSVVKKVLEGLRCDGK